MYKYKNPDGGAPSDEALSRLARRGKAKIAIISIFCVAIIGFSSFLAIDRFFIPLSKYRAAVKQLESGEALSASETFSALDGFLKSEDYLDESYSILASGAVDAEDFALAEEYYSKTVNREAPAAMEFHQKAEGLADRYFDLGFYEKAHDCYMTIGLTEGAQRCVESLYNSLVALSGENVCGVPSGFDAPMLKGYKDSDKYALAYRLEVSRWDTDEEIAKNISLCYELGDFKDTAKSGFLSQRLYGHKYSNSDGYYFMMNEYYDWKYNIPSYRFAGYYGLYSKFSGGTFYIGSDEKESWTKQFRFEFSDMDKTLKVYSFRTGGTYTLTKEY
ncbi:MAG: hypothetical protein RRZ42_01695 [Oscillospiraceae bacterium]